ncbi:hypothetical protein [Burkholderia guangdongensis]|uniref:hypothetical protein n=1 Tax=Burkholderia guangdongensis TaxID=1792500 RepID=UPI0015CD04C6|nr:hypothetical protein [Burkholderia guangdongensis]
MEATQQLYPCALVEQVVVVTRIHELRQTGGLEGRAHRELIFEQCVEAGTCPKAGQCPL